MLSPARQTVAEGKFVASAFPTVSSGMLEYLIPIRALTLDPPVMPGAPAKSDPEILRWLSCGGRIQETFSSFSVSAERSHC